MYGGRLVKADVVGERTEIFLSPPLKYSNMQAFSLKRGDIFWPSSLEGPNYLGQR